MPPPSKFVLELWRPAHGCLLSRSCEASFLSDGHSLDLLAQGFSTAIMQPNMVDWSRERLQYSDCDGDTCYIECEFMGSGAVLAAAQDAIQHWPFVSHVSFTVVACSPTAPLAHPIQSMPQESFPDVSFPEIALTRSFDESSVSAAAATSFVKPEPTLAQLHHAASNQDFSLKKRAAASCTLCHATSHSKAPAPSTAFSRSAMLPLAQLARAQLNVASTPSSSSAEPPAVISDEWFREFLCELEKKQVAIQQSLTIDREREYVACHSPAVALSPVPFESIATDGTRRCTRGMTPLTPGTPLRGSNTPNGVERSEADLQELIERVDHKIRSHMIEASRDGGVEESTETESAPAVEAPADAPAVEDEEEEEETRPPTTAIVSVSAGGGRLKQDGADTPTSRYRMHELPDNVRTKKCSSAKVAILKQGRLRACARSGGAAVYVQSAHIINLTRETLDCQVVVTRRTDGARGIIQRNTLQLPPMCLTKLLIGMVDAETDMHAFVSFSVCVGVDAVSPPITIFAPIRAPPLEASAPSRAICPSPAPTPLPPPPPPPPPPMPLVAVKPYVALPPAPLELLTRLPEAEAAPLVNPFSSRRLQSMLAGARRSSPPEQPPSPLEPAPMDESREVVREVLNAVLATTEQTVLQTPEKQSVEEEEKKGEDAEEEEKNVVELKKAEEMEETPAPAPMFIIEETAEDITPDLDAKEHEEEVKETLEEEKPRAAVQVVEAEVAEDFESDTDSDFEVIDSYDIDAATDEE